MHSAARTLQPRSSACRRTLPRQGLSLKVYDCYRPARAVRAMAGWAHDGRSGEATRRFFPKLPKGLAVCAGIHFLTLAALDRSGGRPHLDCRGGRAATPLSRGPHTAPAPDRPPSAAPTTASTWGRASTASTPRSHTASGDITSDQRQSRRKLVAAMAAHGFHNYHREWWHFSYGRLGIAAGGYDFPIRPRTTVNHAGGHADERAGRR